jgi:adenylate cyclase
LERRLAAILAADVAGYNRLMGNDEAGTLRRFTELRQGVLEPLVAKHRGRVVKLIGDGLLVEFASVVDALICALAWQESVAEHEATADDDKRLYFRIGINLGDVIVEGEDIHGDGVNVAAHLEALAEPGGVYLSDDAFRQVRGKIEADFEDLGEHDLKNVAEPVRVYMTNTTASGTIAARFAGETLPLPDKPSIAVLPFDNMSGDLEQDYFSDGITEDIITALSRFQNLTVIARNSTFNYKGKTAEPQDIGRDLGVRYVVEGSVRKAGDRIRVTVQLIEAETGKHIWADKYDRQLDDIFELQDELTRTAKVLHHRGSQEDNEKARELLDEAIGINPDLASAYFWKACCVSQGVMRGYIEEDEDVWDRCLEWTKKGYSIDDNDFEVLWGLCEWHMGFGEWDQAELVQEKAFQLNPNDPRVVAQKGELLTWLGRPEEAVVWIERVMQLDPYSANNWAHLLGQALFGARRYEDAVQAFLRVPSPSYGHHAYMAACYAYLGLEDRAKAQTATTLEKKANFSAKEYVSSTLFPPLYQKKEDVAHLLDGLRKAGLPE